MAVILGDVPNFTPQRAAELVGLPYPTLDSWNRKGFIQPSVQSSQGRGKVRYYSFADLVQLKIARELREAGVSMQGLRRMVDTLKGLGYQNPLAEQYLVTDGHDVYLVDKDGPMSALKRPGQRCLAYVLDLPETLKELTQRVAELQAA